MRKISSLLILILGIIALASCTNGKPTVSESNSRSGSELSIEAGTEGEISSVETVAFCDTPVETEAETEAESSLSIADWGGPESLFGAYVAEDKSVVDPLIQNTCLTFDYDEYYDNFHFCYTYLNYACTGVYTYSDGEIVLKWRDMGDKLKEDMTLVLNTLEDKTIVLNKEKSYPLEKMESEVIGFSDAVKENMIFTLSSELLENQTEEYIPDYTAVNLGDEVSIAGEYTIVNDIEYADKGNFKLILKNEDEKNVFEIQAAFDDRKTVGEYTYTDGILKLSFKDTDENIGVTKDREFIFYTDEERHIILDNIGSWDLTKVDVGLPVMYLFELVLGK